MTAQRKKQHPPGEKEIDRQMENTFPASDPPSWSGGDFVGAPEGRKTPENDLPARAEKAHRRKP